MNLSAYKRRVAEKKPLNSPNDEKTGRKRYRRILFVLKLMRKDVSLASHYLERFGHLIGPNVEIWEFDMDTDSRSGESSARRILKLLSPASASTQSGGFYCGLMSTVSSNLP